MVEVINPNTGKKVNFYVEPRLKKFLIEQVGQDLAKKDKDYPILVDGYEGAGKSTFAQQIGAVVDPTLDLNNLCMSAKEFKARIMSSKKNQCIIYDEAVTGLTAADSISRIGKLLKSLMMQMRQKNLFIIVILPTVFDLNRYVVLGRAKALFHIYETGGRRGYFAGYNRKDMKKIFLQGKKTYTYTIRTRFRGRFYGKYVVDEAEYRKKKEEALDNAGEEVEFDKYMVRDKLFTFINQDLKVSLAEISKKMAKLDMPISPDAIGLAVRKYKLKKPPIV